MAALALSYMAAQLSDRLQPPVKNTFIHFAAVPEDGCAEDAPRKSISNILLYGMGRSWAQDGALTLSQTGPEPLQAPQGDFDLPEDPDALPSKGSAEHFSGTCTPCAWYWKPSGCSKGPECICCHLCDKPAMRKRQRQRRAARRDALRTEASAL